MSVTHYAMIAGAVLLALTLIWFGVRGLRHPKKSRVHIWNGGAPFALLVGIIILWGTAWVILLNATDYRVNINRWWFAPEHGGIWWGVLSPIMVTLLLAVCLLWWWPRDAGVFLRELKTRDGRRAHLWDFGGSAVALLAAVAVLTLGIWLMTRPGVIPDGIAWLFGVLLVMVAWGAAMGAGWLYARLVPKPRRRRVES